MCINKFILIISIGLSIAYSSSMKYKTNSLIDEQSPYLLQHRFNPINWYAWNQKTLQKAKDENKLIFLSIGYSTCHWCHVMEKETFSNKILSKLFNKDYISIKIDRELMSDLDIYYQNILSKFKTQRNGWPLSVILTPNLEVLYITTYIPPTFKYGVEGIDILLPKFAKLYKSDKVSLLKLINTNKELIAQKSETTYKNNKALEYQYIKAMSEVYDDGFKGFFTKPRFPLASNINLLYDIYDLTKNRKAKKMVYEPLTAMANGGIYDQIEGAFFRYSVYPDWMIPHFEKMLYTTAELVPLYARAYLDTKKVLFKKVVEQSLFEIENKFLKDNLFYSASDADSNHKEGEYFIYDYQPTFNALLKNGYSKDEAIQNLDYLDIYEVGNFEKTFSNVHFNNNDEEDKKPKKLQQTLNILKQIRSKKEYPFIDKKIITSWNAMMIKAFFKAAYINDRYKSQAILYLDTLLQNLYINGKLYHFKIGTSVPVQEAILEDYSFLIDTLLEAYENTYDKKYLKLAAVFTKTALEKFYKNKVWYLSTSIINAKADFNDRYYTSALGLMFHNLITVASLNYDLSLLYKTKKMIKNYENQILSDISAHPEALRAMIRLEKGDIILKSNKQNLLLNKYNIRDIKYPFLLTSYEKSDDYLACDEKSCFSYDKDFNKIKQNILKKIKE